ncbi:MULTISPECIES: STAS domain-containing protein [Amycolatopsis]|uniref:STAS domain-containing protein n=1 Tax=Amycolatopsis tucumanensis TaxID=401106 RepID=A0ABP7JAL9_9PSEU|nr:MULTISPECIES: STAS domain-containing protein [Amycolatopsis]MCF6424329.1 STAS domain-containing protein [Amycolatopsis tucumanensis]
MSRAPRVPEESAGLSTSTPLHVSVRWPSRDVAVLAVGGELDLATAGRLEAAFRRLMARRPRVVVVDLSGVAFLGSSGLAAITAALTSGVVLRIVAPGSLARIFALTALDKVLDLYGTVDEALAAG